MKKPLLYRQRIPFFHDKSEAEFRQDPYERFDPVVIRQSALHLADKLWKGYPFRAILDWILGHCPNESGFCIAEIGCGVGRMIARIAQERNAECWGLDYSYQMLRQAQSHWISGQKTTIDFTSRGLEQIEIPGHQILNLNFGLAKAEQLPFEDHSQDIVYNSFLIDRLKNPKITLTEMHRILRPGGLLLLVSPFNFQYKKHWEQWYPEEQLITKLKQIGFELKDLQKDLNVIEPLDAHGNSIHWNCTGIALTSSQKPSSSNPSLQ